VYSVATSTEAVDKSEERSVFTVTSSIRINLGVVVRVTGRSMPA
jgi:hypothetical protein